MATTRMMVMIIISIIIIIGGPHQALALDCYQCDSNSNLECSEKFDPDTTALRPEPCDNVFEAKFCIKTTGMYGGKIGTMRNCSSRDLGDRCSYLKRVGDQRYVRSCVYTCTGDGCNAGQGPNFKIFYLFLIFVLLRPEMILIN